MLLWYWSTWRFTIRSQIYNYVSIPNTHQQLFWKMSICLI